MIHAVIGKQALIEAQSISENGIVALLDACMNESGMCKKGGRITFDHGHQDKENSVLICSSHEQYSPEDVLKEVVYDNCPNSVLLITQHQNFSS